MTGAAASTTKIRMLAPGASAPWFHAAELSGNPKYVFHTVGGRHVLLLFMGSAKIPAVAEALTLIAHNRALFDDARACFFGVTCDPEDASAGRIAQQLPGIRFFLDYNLEVSRLYAAADADALYPQWVLLDPMLRVVRAFPVHQGQMAIDLLRDRIAGVPQDQWAPVLLVPDVLEPALCAELIEGYRKHGGTPSGFMRDVDGKTRMIVDPRHKQRCDWSINDEALTNRLLTCLNRSLRIPMQRAFQFLPTRIERYIVACYPEGAGYFRAHRDNTTKGTAHRKFAVTINLNAGEYDGGELRFPEFGDRAYRAPTGGAIVFSCSLLHEALPVTRGERFAFLPFFYDEEGAKIRETNHDYLAEDVKAFLSADAANEAADQPPSTSRI